MAEPLLTIQLKVDELKAMGDALARAQVEKRMVQGALDTLVPIARQEVPRRTGRLAGAIRGSMTPRGQGWEGLVRAMGPGFYGRILAMGTNPKNEFIVPNRARARRGNRGRGPVFGEYLTQVGTVVTTRQRGSFVSLRFHIGGGEFFRRRTKSPKLKPNPWPDRTAGRGIGPVATENERIIQAALDAKP